jgi:hypothetical protein
MTSERIVAAAKALPTHATSTGARYATPVDVDAQRPQRHAGRSSRSPGTSAESKFTGIQNLTDVGSVHNPNMNNIPMLQCPTVRFHSFCITYTQVKKFSPASGETPPPPTRGSGFPFRHPLGETARAWRH